MPLSSALLGVWFSFSNKLGAECARALAEALRGNTVLTVVHLRSNGLGTAGAAALAEAVRGNTVFTELRLEVNDLGTAGAAALAEALRGNAGLTELYLNGNGIGATVSGYGARCLCWALTPGGSGTRQRVVPTDRHSFVACQ